MSQSLITEIDIPTFRGLIYQSTYAAMEDFWSRRPGKEPSPASPASAQPKEAPEVDAVDLWESILSTLSREAGSMADVIRRRGAWTNPSAVRLAGLTASEESVLRSPVNARAWNATCQLVVGKRIALTAIGRDNFGAVGLITFGRAQLPWTPEEVEALRAHYPTKTPVEMAELLPARSSQSVNKQATTMGLRKADGYKVRMSRRKGLSTMLDLREASVVSQVPEAELLDAATLGRIPSAWVHGKPRFTLKDLRKIGSPNGEC